MSVAVAPSVTGATLPQAPSGSLASNLGFDDFSFHDLVSIVNPLQHLPIVSTIYRALTGDAIKPLERVAGDSLYGGLWGFVSSVANVAYQQITGKDFGETALAFLEGDRGAPTTSRVAVVQNSSNAPWPIGAANIPTADGPPRALLAAQLIGPGTSAGVPTFVQFSSMNGQGIDVGLSRHAAAAYRRSLATSSPNTILSF